MVSIINQIGANSYRPVINPINIVVNSNQTGQCNFRYIADLYIDDVFVFRWKLFPDPATGYGFFQLSGVISDYLQENLNFPLIAGVTAGSSATQKSIVKVQLRFGEEYDNSTNCDGNVVIYDNLLNSNVFYVFNGTFQYEDFPNYVDNDYKVVYNVNANRKFLTNSPRGELDLTWNDSYYLDFVSETAPLNTSLEIELDSGVTYSIPITPQTNVRRFRITCGPYNVNRGLAQNIINSKVKWYNVYLRNDNGSIPTEKWTIKVKAPSQWMTKFGFIGLLGSPEHITFYHRNQKTIDIERQNYKRFLLSNKSNFLTYDVGDRELTTFNTKAQMRGKVSSFVSRKQSEWLNELWLSNNVWEWLGPEMVKFRVFREDSTPTSRMLFWTDGDFNVGDGVWVMPDNKPEYGDYFVFLNVVSVSDNWIDLGVTFNIFNITEEVCGWLIKNEDVKRMPLVVSDRSIEIKQKLDRPIQYELNWQRSVDMKTLRG
jgi:hypothetical protein